MACMAKQITGLEESWILFKQNPREDIAFPGVAAFVL
jgi:hypothetical protein